VAKPLPTDVAAAPKAEGLLVQGLKYALVALLIFVPAALMLILDLPVVVTLTVGLACWVAASGFWLLAFVASESVKRARSTKPLILWILAIALPPAIPVLIALS
jgi:hypothetical protein